MSRLCIMPHLLFSLAVPFAESFHIHHPRTLMSRMTAKSSSEPSPPSPPPLDVLASLAFCRSSPSAVVVTVWPTAHSQAAAARAWLLECGAAVLHEREVAIASSGAVPTAMAL